MIVDGRSPTKSVIYERRERSVAGMDSHPGGCGMNISGEEEESEGSRTGQATVDMAHGKYLYDIPYGVTREIVMSMDADKSWENLAAEIGYSFDKIKHFELEYQKYSGSPTKSLLWDWGSRNATVKDLYNKLKVLNRIREMQILEKYVASAKESNQSRPEKLINSDKDDGANRSLPCVSSINVDELPRPPPPRRKPSESESDSNEINFNQPKCHGTKSKVSCKVLTDSSVKDKQYDDKKIPGTNLQTKMSESTSHANHSSRVPQESVSTTTSNSKASESTDSSSFDFSSIEKSDPVKGFETLKSYMKTDNLSFNDAVALMGTPLFEYKELYEATDGFGTSHQIGAGAFGSVYLGTLRCSKCAIKRLDGENKDLKNDNSSQLRSELTALLRYRHENIVNLYGYAFDGPKLCLVYQYMINGSLEDRLQCKDNTPPLSWDRRIIIASGAARGIQFLHNFGSKPLIHGDIKSANILLDKHFEAKIGDLGQAQHANSGAFTGKLTHITLKDATSKLYGTKAYLAPEVMRAGGNMSVKSDVFAFGVVLLELCSGEKPLDDKREGRKFLTEFFFDLKDETKEDEHKLCQLLRDKRAGECPESFVISLISSASNCLKDKKKDRIEMEKLLHHLEDIEDRWKESHPVSSDISNYCGSVHTHHLSHSSGDNYSAPNLAQNPVKSASFHDQPSSVTPGKQPASIHSHNDVKTPQTPTSPVEYFKGKAFSSLPEAWQLQMMADARKEGKPLVFPQKDIDKQTEGQDSESVEEYQSDPKKMEEIKKFNAQFNSFSHETTVSPFTKSDPHKLEALMQFDREKPMVREPDESSENNGQFPIVDQLKLKKMEEFDRQNSAGSMSSGLLYGDPESPQIAVTVQQQFMQGSSPQMSTGHAYVVNPGQTQMLPAGHAQMQYGHGQTGIPYVLHDGMQQMNVVSQSPTVSSSRVPGHYGQHLSSEGHQTINAGVNILPKFRNLNMGSSPNVSGNFSGSCFSSDSHPTMIPADFSRHTGSGVPQAFPHRHQSGSPINSNILEVYESANPGVQQHNITHGEQTSHSIPRQMTDTNTSQHIIYSQSQSLPEQMTPSMGQTFHATDLNHSVSHPEDRTVQYRANTRQNIQAAQYRQSEGFPYTGQTVHGQGYDEVLHGDGQTEDHTQGQGQSVEGEGQGGEGQMVGESSVDPVEFQGKTPDQKMTNFFDSYFQAVANECEATEDVEYEEGQVEGEEGEEGDDSVTNINV